MDRNGYKWMTQLNLKNQTKNMNQSTKPTTKKKKSNFHYNYSLNEIIWSADSGKLYQAKILRIQELNEDGKVRKYFIHYQGWARKYDCWIDEDMMAPLEHSERIKELQEFAIKKLFPVGSVATLPNNENISADKGKEQNEANNSSKPNKRRLVLSTADDSKIMEAMKRRKQLSMDDLMDEENEKIAEKVQMPFVLKKHLVSEWKAITKKPYCLLKLPKPEEMTVERIFQEFLEQKLTRISDSNDKVQEAKYKYIFDGLQLQFNRALPTILLYRQEREQYDRLMAAYAGKQRLLPSKIYGAEHLLRFFVRLPKLMQGMFISITESTYILSRFAELLRFIGESASKYLDMSKYDNSNSVLSSIGDKPQSENASSSSASSSNEVSEEAEEADSKPSNNDVVQQETIDHEVEDTEVLFNEPEPEETAMICEQTVQDDKQEEMSVEVSDEKAVVSPKKRTTRRKSREISAVQEIEPLPTSRTKRHSKLPGRYTE